MDVAHRLPARQPLEPPVQPSGHLCGRAGRRRVDSHDVRKRETEKPVVAPEKRVQQFGDVVAFGVVELRQSRPVIGGDDMDLIGKSRPGRHESHHPSALRDDAPAVASSPATTSHSTQPPVRSR